MIDLFVVGNLPNGADPMRDWIMDKHHYIRDDTNGIGALKLPQFQLIEADENADPRVM